MASSIQVVAGRAEIFHDLDLLALMSLVQAEIGDTIDAYPLLVSVRTAWLESLVGYGPGAIDLGLEQLAADSRAVGQFQEVLARVRSRLLRFGDAVPDVLLMKHCRSPGVFFSNYSTSMLVTALDRLDALLRHGVEAAQRAQGI